MNLRAANKAIRDIEGVIKKARRNPTCLFPECDGEPIGSHIVARKTLELIADKGHVLTWLPRKVTTWDMVKGDQAGRTLEQLYETPARVGIGDKNKVTDSLFCRDHDNSIFAPLENGEFSFQPEQVVLLAFRALCFMLLRILVTQTIVTEAQKRSYPRPPSTPETLRKLQRFQATDLASNVRQVYIEIHSTRNYDQLGWSMYLVNMPPCIAATYAFIPVAGDDAEAIVNGTHAVSVEDAVSFSFLPYAPLNSSICVISWLRGSQRAQQFINLNRVNELSETEQRDVFLRFAFESPIIYISPTWWQSLSDEKREEYKRMHLDADRRHEDLV